MAIHIQVINNVRAKINTRGTIRWGKVHSITEHTLEIALEHTSMHLFYLIRERLGCYETQKDNSIMEYRCTLTSADDLIQRGIYHGK